MDHGLIVLIRHVRSWSLRHAFASVVGKVPPTLVSPELLPGKTAPGATVARSRAACGLRDVSLPPWHITVPPWLITVPPWHITVPPWLITVPPWLITLVPRLVALHVCLLVATRAAMKTVVHLADDTPLDSTQIIGVEVCAPVETHLAKYRLGHIVFNPFSFFS